MARTRKEIRDLRALELLTGYGLTSAQVANVLGVSERTLRRRAKDDSAVMAALYRGRAWAAMTVARVLLELAMAGNVKAIVWWEMTRAGRRAMRPGA